MVTVVLRHLPLIGLALWLHPAGREAMDLLVADLWSTLHGWAPLHHPLAEAVVATLGFWFAGTFFETMHLWWPGADAFRIDSRKTASKKANAESSSAGAPSPSPAPPRRPRAVFRSLAFFLWTKVGGSIVYLGAVAAYHALVRAKPPLPPADAPPSAAQLATEVLFGLWLYDLLFTPVHLFLHWCNKPCANNDDSSDGSTPRGGSIASFGRQLRSALGRLFNHRVHHEMRGTLAAGATVHHSFVDGALQVAVNVAVQQCSPWVGKSLAPSSFSSCGGAVCDAAYAAAAAAAAAAANTTGGGGGRGGGGGWGLLTTTAQWGCLGRCLGHWPCPKHSLSRFAHNVAVTWLLCEAHSGYDLPWMTHRLWPAVCGGAKRHNAHHNRGTVYFQQFFCYIDDFLGTVDKVEKEKRPAAAAGADAAARAE